MANVKITELGAITATDAATDVVAVVDVSADATKKITVTNLLTTPVETQVTTQARTYTAAQRGTISAIAVAAGDTNTIIVQCLCTLFRIIVFV